MLNTTIKLPLEIHSSKKNQCACVLTLVTDRSNDQSNIYYSTQRFTFETSFFGWHIYEPTSTLRKRKAMSESVRGIQMDLTITPSSFSGCVWYSVANTEQSVGMG